jgi:hypothetical protein
MRALIGGRIRQLAKTAVACVALAGFASPARALASEPAGRAAQAATKVSKCTEAALKSAITKAKGGPVDFAVPCVASNDTWVTFTTPLSVGAKSSVDIQANGNEVQFNGGYGVTPTQLFLVNGGTLGLSGIDLEYAAAEGKAGGAGTTGKAGTDGANGANGDDGGPAASVVLAATAATAGRAESALLALTGWMRARAPVPPAATGRTARPAVTKASMPMLAPTRPVPPGTRRCRLRRGDLQHREPQHRGWGVQ